MSTTQQTANQEHVLIACQSCNGTGLDREYPLKDGTAASCRSCRGTGASSVAVFTGRKHVPDVTHVWADIVNKPMSTGSLSGGTSYEEWAQNPEIVHEIGREIREASCPASWYQSANPALKPQWAECERAVRFDQCPLYTEKQNCWKQFDRENVPAE